jgi:hypothetical protein
MRRSVSRRRTVRRDREPDDVRRYAACGLAVAAAFFGLVGLGGITHLALLGAVLATALKLLDTVSDRIAGRVTAGSVVLAVVALAVVIAAAALHAPLLALGALLGLVRLEPLRSPQPLLSK